MAKSGTIICLRITNLPHGKHVEEDLHGMRWISIPPKTFNVVKDIDKRSTCQYELCIDYESFHPSVREEPLDIERKAPLRIMSFDIETDVFIDASGIGQFPKPDKQAIVQIANMLKRRGEAETFYRNVFTLKSCNPIKGADVESYDSEVDLIKRWIQFIREADPDVVIGYNTCGFDIPYIVERARCLKIPCEIGRIKGFEMPRATFRNSGNSAYPAVVAIPGRLQIDLLDYIYFEHYYPSAEEKIKLMQANIDKSLSLQASSFRFLNQKKEDIHYMQIPVLQAGTAEDRKKLAIYCLKDTYLPLQLMDRLEALEKWIGRSQLSKTTFNSMVRNLRR
ncbi:hypothetical protein GYMLUDRAFT_34959 [Collybiopsis luxurians FD-317 M1]|nr:hypothetical protein GYMLUDRAFT_34959 [Collybiopsis luxurians FD-317 M1]